MDGMPKQIWANAAVFGNGEPLAGEWNYRDVGSPDDTPYVRADLAQAPAPDWIANCAVCGRIVDTREKAEGGDGHGCEYRNDWACSSECAEKLNPDPDWMREGLAAQAPAPVLWTQAQQIAFARAYDTEDAAQRGEPTPWVDGEDTGEWVDERVACVRAGLAALEAPDAGVVAELVEAAKGLKAIVEEIRGAMEHGTWRDEKGQRLKDTPEWVAFYNALALIAHNTTEG